MIPKLPSDYTSLLFYTKSRPREQIAIWSPISDDAAYGQINRTLHNGNNAAIIHWSNDLLNDTSPFHQMLKLKQCQSCIINDPDISINKYTHATQPPCIFIS